MDASANEDPGQSSNANRTKTSKSGPKAPDDPKGQHSMFMLFPRW